jgi:acyl-CoA thioesterase-1
VAHVGVLDPPVAHPDHALGVLGDAGVVRHQDDGDPLLLVELLEHLQHLLARARVEVAGGLVGEQQARLVDERAGDRDALLLAAGELRRVVVEPLAEPHALQQLRRAALGLAVGDRVVRVRQRHHHVLQRAGAGQQVEVLEDEPDLAVADERAAVGAEGGNLLAIEPVFAGRGVVETPEDVHERALARATGAHQGDELAARDVHGHALEDRHVDFAEVVGLVDVSEFDQLHWVFELESWSLK